MEAKIHARWPKRAPGKPKGRPKGAKGLKKNEGERKRGKGQENVLEIVDPRVLAHLAPGGGRFTGP